LLRGDLDPGTLFRLNDLLICANLLGDSTIKSSQHRSLRSAIIDTTKILFGGVGLPVRRHSGGRCFEFLNLIDESSLPGLATRAARRCKAKDVL
jgi:hypothetical protein